jgi:biotin carboxyl carrier protein
MRFDLEAGGRSRTVDVRQQPEGYRVALDGASLLVDVAAAGPDTWSLLVRDAHGVVRSVEAVVTLNAVNGTFDVFINGVHVPVQPQNGLGRRVRDSAGSRGQGPQRVLAPMPGKVVRVLVKAGDLVQPRQPLVVIEAMKMENELRAAREGRVREVMAVEGQSVDAGAALVVVDQP